MEKVTVDPDSIQETGICMHKPQDNLATTNHRQSTLEEKTPQTTQMKSTLIQGQCAKLHTVTQVWNCSRHLKAVRQQNYPLHHRVTLE